MKNTERKFNDPLWLHTINTMQQLTAKLPWANRLRHPYYFSFKRNTINGIKLHLSFWIEAMLYFLKHVRFLFKKKKDLPLTTNSITFFLDDNTAYLNALLPICKAMNDKGLQFDIFIPAKNYTKVIARLNLENVTSKSIFSDADFLPNSYFKVFFIAVFKSKLDVFKWITSSVKRKFFLLPNVWQYAFHHHLYHASVHQYLSTKKYLIGAGDHWFWDSMFYCEAQNTPCTSIVAQHGLMGEFNYPMLAKKYWVWGKHDYDVMINNFLANPNEIEIVGSAHFDAFANKIKQTQNPVQKKYITFFTQPYFKYKALGDGLYETVVKWFMALDEVAKKQNINLMMKWHQLDDESYYTFINSETKSSREALDKVLSETIIGITVDSAIMFESAMANVLMIQLKHPDFERFIDFSSDNLTLTVQSVDELQSTVEKLITDKNFLQHQTDLMQKAIFNYLANQTKTVECIIAKIQD